MKLCFDCRIKNNYFGCDEGAHTACLGTCEDCGEEKSILPDRHWKKLTPGLSSFKLWRSQQGYDIRTDKERDLIDYVDSILMDRDELEQRCVRLIKGNLGDEQTK